MIQVYHNGQPVWGLFMLDNGQYVVEYSEGFYEPITDEDVAFYIACFYDDSGHPDASESMDPEVLAAEHFVTYKLIESYTIAPIVQQQFFATLDEIAHLPTYQFA